jgi:DNA-binding response OmpR family regulator
MILDLGLRCGDGFDVMERSHKSVCLAHIPVTVVTGHEVAGNRDRVLHAGAAAFFQKPMEGGTLLLTIGLVLDRLRGKLRSASSGTSCYEPKAERCSK